MMAEESSPSAGALSEETIAMLRTALVRFAASPDDGELRDALRLVSDEARARGILPEQLLTTLKDMWHAVPNVRVATGGEPARLLQRMVTICIKEYYSS
ncbi:MAG TPA: hypothetical protein VL524_05560 [Gemmatimonadaceae bacterium]|jgi:hypothetical protein|nr:hypothetical protein [Gemmatimonadaceae bacterium]